MNEWLQRIELHPRVCNGKPVIRDTRIPVQVLVEQIAAGETWEHLLRGYPGLEREDLRAALLYASVTMERVDFVPSLAA